MNDMTDEELVEYVMLLSKDQEEQQQDQVSAQEISEIQRLLDLEQEEQEEEVRRIQEQIEDAGPSSISGRHEEPVSGEGGYLDDLVSERERREEEDLVQRAIEMSMLDMDPTEDHHGHDHDHGYAQDLDHDHDHDHGHGHSHGAELDHAFRPADWDESQIVNVDSAGLNGQTEQEDQTIVQSILDELEEADFSEAKVQSVNGSTEAWPSIGKATSSSLPNMEVPVNGASPSNGKGKAVVIEEEQPAKKAPMTWSMVARASKDTSSGPGVSTSTSTSSMNGKAPAIIKQYTAPAGQEEIEDEDTLLARILSLSLVEK